MPRTKHTVIFSTELLKEYNSAALKNAESLYQEAYLLLSERHYARAYFLAVASLEETGKAALAFNALGRKLADSAVQSRLNEEFQDHGAKISAAFLAMFKGLSQTELRENFQYIIDLQVSLKFGREPSMYIGINKTGSLHIPNNVVRPQAAADCVRLAKDCLEQTKSMVRADKPFTFTSYQDRFFALGKKAKKVWEQSDFGDFLLYVIENEGINSDTIPKCVCTYYDDYLSKDKRFIRQQ